MFVNYFFAGFILGKVPFPLSPSFRPMLQRGIDLPSLEVAYFTSLSYYILLLFGLRGIFTLMFRCGCYPPTATPLLFPPQLARVRVSCGRGRPIAIGVVCK